MVSVLHGNAKTTPRIRKEIQESTESGYEIAKRLNINIKTVYRWRNAATVEDGKSGPKTVRSSLTQTEQQVVCAFRAQTKLPLDDVFVSLRDKIPALTRSNLHRCLQRNGLSRLPEEDMQPTEKKKFKEYPPGYVHVDITEVLLGPKQKFYIFVAIDRTTKLVHVELHDNMRRETACDFMKNTIESFPYKIGKVLTDNGAQFTYALLPAHLRPKDREHPFDIICKENNIDHRLTQFRHPWTNGQVEVFNRVAKKYTTKTYHYETIYELKKHLMAFWLVYTFQRPLKALKYKTPYAKVLEYYETSPEAFRANPHHMIVGIGRESLLILDTIIHASCIR
jgi:transposase InsO family protein